jgi:Beta-propeller repeat
MQRNRTIKGILGGLLVVAMLLSVVPTLVLPVAVSAAAETWYVSYLGGTTYDYGKGIAVDSTGNIYITGYTDSANFPTTLGAYQTTKAGGADAFVAKFSSSGSLVYSTYLGGSGDKDYGNGIVVDSTGNIYITGYTNSANFPITLGAYQTTKAGSAGTINAFVAKFSSGGNLVYSTYLGGSGGVDYGNAIAVSDTGNIYITGRTNSADFPTTPSAYQTTYASGNDAYLAEFNSTGNLVYSTYLGGSGSNDYGNAIAVDGTGNIYITGTTNSANFPTTPGVYQTTISGTGDAFVSKFSSSGSLVYSTYLGGSGADPGYGIAVDSTGNIYVTGMTSSTNYPGTAGGYQPTHAGGTYDVFVAKFNSGWNLVYSTYLGGTGNDFGYGIAVDSTGNIYITGYTASTNFPTTPGAYQTANAGGAADGSVTKFDSSGNLAYSTYLGGSNTDQGNGIAVDNTGNIYIVGQTPSTNFPTTPGAYQTTYGGGGTSQMDAFFASMTIAATPPTYAITASAGANGSIDPSGSVVVNERANQSFTISPATGYHVADVLVDGSSVGAVTTYEFTNVTANHAIEASFAIDTFIISASAGANGSIDPVGDVTVDYGAIQSFAVTTATGYHVAEVLVDGVSVGAVTSYEFTNVAADHTISVSFATDVPAWDMNGDGVCNIGDVVVIGLHWGETGTNGWIPSDLNNDGVINIGDVVVLGLHWGETW